MSVIAWEDPPPTGRKWARVAEELERKPGEWALVYRGLTDSGYWAKRRLKELGCETKSRQAEASLSVWARWPG